MTTSVAPPSMPPPERDPLVATTQTYEGVSDKISGVVLAKPSLAWLFCLTLSVGLLMLLLFSIGWLFTWGVGIWGINIPVGWAFAITSFVWWIGIGHAGTFISAFLLLLHQEWRTSINRFAEAMTLFAVMCAGLFPLVHLGRPWLFYYITPYPNTMYLWPQFRSPLVWDLFAVGTYFTVSLIFWYVGVIPDLATVRDRASSRIKKVIYGVCALGWRGSSRHWKRYHTSYKLLAALAAPLVISVHSVVGMDFAAGIVPGWHETIFPPYFVAGAIFSGFAMVVTLAIPIRHFFHMEDMITVRHLDNCGKLMIVTGMVVCYTYYIEVFYTWYSGNVVEVTHLKDMYFGLYGPIFWVVIFCNVGLTQLLWFRRIRRSALLLFLVSLGINVGMWLERFCIITQALHRDYLPSKWEVYAPTFWDYATLIGSFGLFCTCFFLFVKYVPVVSISEMRALVREKGSPSSH